MMWRVAVYGRLVQGGVLTALSSEPDVFVSEADDPPALVSMAATSDILVIPDLPGEDGAALAAVLRDPGCPVRWVHLLSAGYHGLLRHDLGSRVIVTNQGGATASVVAEHAIALLLGLTRRIAELAPGRPEPHRDGLVARLSSLDGKTMVIVGMGHVGRALARLASAFGMTVLGVSRTVRAWPYTDESHPVEHLYAVLARADVVALATALTAETSGLFGSATFEACKPGSILVNVGRGELVDTDALLEALRSKRIGGAALDVVSPPQPPGSSLRTHPGVLVSPHVAGRGSAAAYRRLVTGVLDNLDRFRRTAPLSHVVHDPEGAGVDVDR